MSITYPRIRLYLNAIDYVDFVDTDVVSGTVVQEVNPISAELPISTLTFSIFTTDPAYSMFQSGAFVDSLSKRQAIYVYETVDAAEYLMGKFYLDEWKNLSEWEFQFKAIDLIGLLEREDFAGLFYTSPTAISTIIADFLPAVTTDYIVDATLGARTLEGYIEPGTYRDALRQVLFAGQGAAVTARSDQINLTLSRYPINDDIPDYLVDRFQIVQGRSVELLPMVTSLKIHTHDWIASLLDEELFKGDVVIGTYRFNFDKPYYDYAISGVTGSFTSGSSWIEITVTAPGTLVVTGKPYINKENIYFYDNPDASIDDKRNDLVVKEAYLLSPSLVSAGMAEDTMIYFRQRHKQACSVYGANSININLMDMPIVDTMYSAQIRGIIEKAVIDLTGGFRTDFDVVGVEHIVQRIYIGAEDGTTAISTEDGAGLITQR